VAQCKSDSREAEVRAGAAKHSEDVESELARLRAELARAQARIAELEAHADIDPLLEILNRRGFDRELARAMSYVGRYQTPAVLMFIDLDGFKAVNDKYGHAAGDALLQAVARELTTHVRASDVVGRLGGDEFGVIMWHVEPTLAAGKARELERLIEAVKLPQGSAAVSAGASAGIVPIEPDTTPAALIEAADRAMYARKRERRGG
jgi:diguanylate cyclase (GGDEF)-like protein